MVQHEPWRGPKYRTAGIDGQRICIVGYSHWLAEGEKDSRDLTKRVISGMIDGSCDFKFFNQIRSYFGFEDNAFWNHVMFFNFLNECVGGPNERYMRGRPEQEKRANERFLRVIRQKPVPHKVLVFTTRGWSTLPPCREEADGQDLRALNAEKFPGFSYGTYDVSGHIVTAFGLRHPQGASRQLMRKAVQYVLKRKIPD
jgi:hypothetical protein